VLRHLGRGLSNQQLGQALGISPETVKSHVKAIFHKLDATGRAEAISRAYELGLLSIDR
jgi:DNA-binding CsgD family transcriptional regulator